jgi:Flp pilus assembly protein TadG
MAYKPRFRGGMLIPMLQSSDHPESSRFAHLRGLCRPHFRRRCSARGEQGAALVEMALATVILLVMLFGIMEMSLGLYTYHFISEAAREATRYAIVRGSSCGGAFATACPASPDDIQTYVQNLGYPGIDPTAITVTTAWSAYPAGGACGSCNNPGNQVQVTVNYQYLLSIPFIPSQTLNMSSTSEMVISQ